MQSSCVPRLRQCHGAGYGTSKAHFSGLTVLLVEKNPPTTAVLGNRQIKAATIRMASYLLGGGHNSGAKVVYLSSHLRMCPYLCPCSGARL